MDPHSQRKQDLETLIREKYRLLKEYEDKLHFADDPRRKAGYQKEIEQLKASIANYLAELQQLNKDLPPERALPLPSERIGEGFTELSKLARMSTVRTAVGGFRTVFQNARKQIGVLSDYKRLHDLFQELEVRYNLIYQDGKRVSGDQTAWEDLEYNEPDLRNIIDELLEFATHRMYEALWRQKLKRVQKELQAAVENCDTKQLKNAIRRLKDVLSREPSKINTHLVSAVDHLNLSALVDAMKIVSDNLAHSSLNGEAVGQFEKLKEDVIALTKLEDSLTVCVANHDSLQEMDDELRRVEALLDQDSSELEDAWPDIKQIARIISDRNQTDWAIKLYIISDELDSALSDSDQGKIRRHFRSYRSYTSRSFKRIDRDMLTLCEELQKVGEPLDRLLGMI